MKSNPSTLFNVDVPFYISLSIQASSQQEAVDEIQSIVNNALKHVEHAARKLNVSINQYDETTLPWNINGNDVHVDLSHN